MRQSLQARLAPLLAMRNVAPLAAIFLICLINFTRYPGASNPDSNWQYQQILQGRLNDWHPPMTARLWQMLLVFGPGTGPMFAFNILCYWSSVALTAVGFALRSKPIVAWAILCLAAQPIMLMLNINIAKDITMGATFLLGLSLVFFSRQNAERRIWVDVTATLLLVTAILMRANAVFVAAPLLLYVWRPSWLARPLHLLIASALLGFALIPISTILNRHVLQASDGRAIHTLQLYDVAGIVAITGDHQLLGKGQEAVAVAREMRRCYTPILRDTLGYRSLGCAVYPQFLALTRKPGGPPSLGHVWRKAIIIHPFAYMSHRLRHFNSTTYFWVPSHHTEAAFVLKHEKDRHRGVASVVLDKIRYSPFTTPAFVIAWGLFLLPWMIASNRHAEDRDMQFALALNWAALVYAGTFLVVGVATDQRYFFFTLLAIMIATPIAISVRSFRDICRKHLGLLAITALVPSSVLVAILIARVLLPVPTAISVG